MYSTNAEYRALIREYFNMDIQTLEKQNAHLKELCPEYYDEMLYDDEAMKRGIEDILNNTRDDQRFIELYTKAAGQFLSENIETGVCVLLTYDYFSDFIKFYENPTDEGFYHLLQRI
jgi:hypothetical protein